VIKLLAEGAGDEGLGVATLAAVAAGQIDLRRANFRRGHIETLAGVETLGLANGHSGGQAIGRSVGRNLAFLVATDHACAGNPRNRTGGVFSSVDSRLGSDAGLVAEILDSGAGALEVGTDIARLFIEPAHDAAEETRTLGFLRIFLGRLLRECQRGAECDRTREQAGSGHVSLVRVRNSIDAHGRSM